MSSTKTAREPEQPREIEFTEEELKRFEERGHNVALRAFVATIFHPFTFAKTLIQLGHEPYPLVKGKKWLFIGEQVNFQPNVFKYLKNIYHSHGLKTIYTGLGANLAVTITGDLGGFFITLYMDKYYPEIGGEAGDLEKEAAKDNNDLDSHQLVRVKVRRAIRDSIAHTIGVIAARPFTVIMIRQIAQHIGNETKYQPYNPLQVLLRIGSEEGPSGYFSGLIPQLIGGIVYICGIAAVSYAAEEGIRFLEKNQDPHDEEGRNVIRQMRQVCGFVTPYLVNGWRYSFEVVSTVMAVAGSGLAISMLPYTPMFTHWADAYDYMKPYEIKRGRNVILRQEQGAIGVGIDGKLYASKKHFI